MSGRRALRPTPGGMIGSLRLPAKPGQRLLIPFPARRIPDEAGVALLPMRGDGEHALRRRCPGAGRPAARDRRTRVGVLASRPCVPCASQDRCRLRWTLFSATTSSVSEQLLRRRKRQFIVAVAVDASSDGRADTAAQDRAAGSRQHPVIVGPFRSGTWAVRWKRIASGTRGVPTFWVPAGLRSGRGRFRRRFLRWNRFPRNPRC